MVNGQPGDSEEVPQNSEAFSHFVGEHFPTRCPLVS